MALDAWCVLFIIFAQSMARGSGIFTCTPSLDLLVYTVATDDNDASQRFRRSAETNGFNVKVIACILCNCKRSLAPVKFGLVVTLRVILVEDKKFDF